MNLFEELKERGLINQTTDEKTLQSMLDSQSIKYYVGFDPTAPSLHIGNLVQLIVMKHLQLAGHQPYALVGGATGLIGDPKQKGDRVMNSAETVLEWTAGIKKQIENILDFSDSIQNRATVINNYDWTSQISAIDFLRDIGKHFRLSPMLAKDTIATRLNSPEGISYTEFSYQILQGNDFLHLYKNYGVTLQIGGSDQWGNLTSGLDLIRKTENLGADAGAGSTDGAGAGASDSAGTKENIAVMTTELITDSTGNKFGKSEGNAIWLNPEMTSPYKFYQFWLNLDDELAVKMLKIFTFLPLSEIAEITREHNESLGARIAQKKLAYEATALVHGTKAADDAINTSNALFSKDPTLLQNLPAESLKDLFEGLSVANLAATETIAKGFVETGLCSSNSEVMRNLKSGALSVNGTKIEDTTTLLADFVPLSDGSLLLKFGKKKMAVVQVCGNGN
jgi:tyrosyl-tRNA synthetase